MLIKNVASDLKPWVEANDAQLVTDIAPELPDVALGLRQIGKEFQSRIFERSFRNPGTEDSTGVGLGLAIAREMIVSHGGSIGLQSTPGTGSEFYFDLPATSNGVKA